MNTMVVNGEVRLNPELLDLILLVQSYRRFKRNEIIMFGNISTDCADEMTRYYFNKLPEELLSRYGLKRNLISYEKVINFHITKEMMETEMSKLDKFVFSK